MKKRAIILAVLFFCATFMVMGSDPQITITQPTDGQFLLIGISYTIRWTHSSYFDVSRDGGQIVCGDASIGYAPVTSDQFVWTVGQRRDGTFMAPGTYRLGIESIDYWTSEGPDLEPTINLVRLEIPRKFILKEIPQCPRCFYFDPRSIKFAGVRVLELQLVCGGQMLAKLGRFSLEKISAAPVKIVLADETGFSKRRQGFEIHALTPGGKLIHKQAIEVEFQK